MPALGALARGWRQDLAAFVIGVTGSVGKTSTKDLIAAMIAPHRSIAASRENYNTEIGLPLEILAAPFGTEVLVLELAMRGFGQIRELAAICEPDVGVITNIGPVHLEQMGSLEGVAEAKAELLDGLQPGGTAVVPSDEPLLEPWLRDDLEIVTFGPAGDVHYEGASLRSGVVPDAPPTQPRRDRAGRAGRARAAVRLAPQPAQRSGRPGRRAGDRGAPERQDRRALLLDAGRARRGRIGRRRDQRLLQRQPAVHACRPRRSRLAPRRGPPRRGARRHARARPRRARAPPRDRRLRGVGGRRAARHRRPARRGDARPFDGEAHAVLDADEAAALLPELVRPGDVVLVKASRGVGLEVVTEALQAAG